MIGVADVVRRLFSQLGIGTLPSSNNNAGPWACWANEKPSRPEEIIIVYDTEGLMGDRYQIDGTHEERHGLQVVVRAGLGEDALAKALEIADDCARLICRQTVQVGGICYLVHSVSRITGVVPLGPESPESRRALAGFNALATISIV